MNPVFYDLIIQKKLLLPAPAKAKQEIRYKVRKVVKNRVIKYISTPIIPEDTPTIPEPEPDFEMYR